MKQDFFEHGCFYHVYNRGNNSEDIFKEEKNYEYFLMLLKKYVLPVADIYAYCLLKNHFHLLVRIKEEKEITCSDKMRAKPYLGFSHLFNTYTQSVNKLYNRTGSLFQEHLKRKRITDDIYLIQSIAYIHLNPVKHSFTTGLDYPHSSYKAMLSNKPTMLKRDEVMYYFEDKENFIYWHDFQRIKHQEILMLIDEDID